MNSALMKDLEEIQNKADCVAKQLADGKIDIQTHNDEITKLQSMVCLLGVHTQVIDFIDQHQRYVKCRLCGNISNHVKR